LSTEQIDAFIDGVVDGSWADYQIAALLMAMFTRGLGQDEQDKLTHAMLHSGEVLDLSDIDAPKADKHSTGGVGDKTSLIIAPLAAACGVAVPMISGRGLGHTGGTLDKLESIPGYKVDLSTEEFRRIVKECGYAMAGQTHEIAPADKKLYALCDATATVPYIPLIVGSIMSKKLAEGLDALVLDVKTGSGAFMKSLDDAKALAKALVQTGNAFGVRTEAVISDMGQPLGRYVGNSLEVYECIKILRGEADEFMMPTYELSVELASRMLVLTGIADSQDEAMQAVIRALHSGAGLEKFRQNVELQGGDPRICDDPEMLVEKDLTAFEVASKLPGFVCEIDALKIGSAMIDIGGGRTKADEGVDPAVGYSCKSKLGKPVEAGEPLGIVYCRSREQAASVAPKLLEAYVISEEAVSTATLVHTVVS
jgi:pyrimidine-nucleoside phosphorylase